MVFSSLTFIFFFLPATLIAYYFFKNRSWRNVVLLLASLFFYAWGEPFYVLLMLVSIFTNWIMALAITRYNKYDTFLLAGGVTLNLASVGVFKYGNFLIKNISTLLKLTWTTPKIALPIGISFYTFQAVSYLVDIYRGSIKPQKNLAFFGSYLAMFPQLIAGPIIRYRVIESDLLERRENLNDFSVGVRRFVLGLSKKVLIANTMGSIADTILVTSPTVGAFPAWYAFIAYFFQIYFDFSGYSDMAIGLGRMFGFHFPENFNYPYIARSITDFWRRWHISLSSFFRDYVYISLGGDRVTRGRWLLNLMIVWGLTGLWHGASWNFICWGIYYGILLIGENMLWGKSLKLMSTPLQHVYTVFIIIIGWVIFRIEDFGLMYEWIGSLIGLNGLGQPGTLSALNVLQYYPWFIIALIGSTPLCARLMTDFDKAPVLSWLPEIITVSLFSWSMVALAMGEFNPFIYFRF